MRSAAVCLITILPAISAVAQEGLLSYRLRFSVSETGQDGKPVTRRHGLLAGNESRAKVNATRRIPYDSSQSANPKRTAKQVQTAALGVIIECTPRENGSGVQLECTIESSFAPPNQPQHPVGFLPVTLSRQVSASVLLELGREHQLAVLDDPATNNRLEIPAVVERSGR